MSEVVHKFQNGPANTGKAHKQCECEKSLCFEAKQETMKELVTCEDGEVLTSKGRSATSLHPGCAVYREAPRRS